LTKINVGAERFENCRVNDIAHFSGTPTSWILMSALGQKRTFVGLSGMSANGPKADSCAAANAQGYSITSSATAISVGGISPGCVSTSIEPRAAHISRMATAKIATLT
jgi:hypothetical protein